uniref:Formin binding protein 4 n=1 Tax=Tetraodon nigroviridis TaxID=99883 RepID=H3CSE7_TETNG
MGKKSRLAGAAAGRRTILQLSPPGHRSGNAGERDEPPSGSDDKTNNKPSGVSVNFSTTLNQEKQNVSDAPPDEQEGDSNKAVRQMRPNMKTPAVKATEGLSLLGAYEDSDEEDSGNVRTSAANSQLNHSTDIDSTLANFMAEIDAITTQPSSDQTASQSSLPTTDSLKPQGNNKSAASEEQKQSTEFVYNTQYSLATVDVEMGDWQEVWDENSGCYYYWNTLTNEVSWELPHYLANQVQSLEQCANSGASVNGNGTAHAGNQSNEAAPASTASLTTVKENKPKKEVMESVVGLASEEEERQGVAASLLGPLIPSEVKEAEEKWRKRLIKSLDEPEKSLDSDGEGVGPTDLPEPTSDPADQKSLNAKKPSGETSQAEEEAEEDTMDLELALERKKAELRALEEGDVSAGGSSPCSETSQEASGPRGVLLKKNRWKTIFPGVASPDSNSRSSDLVENTETGIGEGENNESPEEKTVSKPAVKEEAETSDVKVETPELKFQIGQLANTLISKMEFLGINKKAISNFQLLLLQTETRIADWREGALDGVYLRRRLQEAAEHIKYYELNATPKGWSCHWDREHRRYFYVNDRTGASQWEFPTEEENCEDPKGSQGAETQGADQPDTKAPTSGAAATGQPPLPRLPNCHLVPFVRTFSCPQPRRRLLSPAPHPSGDGEIMEVEMEMDDDDTEPPAPGTEEEAGTRPALPPGAVVTNQLQLLEPWGPLAKGQKRQKTGQQNKAVIGSSPILYTQAAVSAGRTTASLSVQTSIIRMVIILNPSEFRWFHDSTFMCEGFPLPAAPLMTAAAYWGIPAASLLPCEPPPPPVPALPPQPPLPPPQPPSEPAPPKTLPTDKTKKVKKDKSKKKIKMPSLVKKWQSIQKELDEEEKSSSSDEDRDQLNKKSIEEWKHQQILTGKASKNANFEALPEDWRDRIKRRKMNT